jgi:hypothetical protein
MRDDGLSIYDPHSVKKTAISLRALQGAKNNALADMEREKAAQDEFIASLTRH